MRMVLLLLFSMMLGSPDFANAQTCAALPNNLTNGNTADATQVMANFNSLLSCINNNAASPPTGRLTLVSGSPVMSAPTTGASSIIYTPAVGNSIPLWNGSTFVATPFLEVTQALTDATKSPSAATAGNVYDLFVWSDSGTIRCTRGPAWTTGTGGSNTARGTGAGSTALTRVSGMLVNANAIPNGPAAGYGVYVGTIATDAAAATVSFQPSATTGTGGIASIGVWNTYNRHSVSTGVTSSTSNWSYSSSAIREVQGAPFRSRFVVGLAEDGIVASYQVFVAPSNVANSSGNIGVALDANTQFDSEAVFWNPVAAFNYTSPISTNVYGPQLGLHYIAALEASDGTNSQSFFSGKYNLLAVSTTY